MTYKNHYPCLTLSNGDLLYPGDMIVCESNITFNVKLHQPGIAYHKGDTATVISVRDVSATVAPKHYTAPMTWTSITLLSTKHGLFEHHLTGVITCFKKVSDDA